MSQRRAPEKPVAVVESLSIDTPPPPPPAAAAAAEEEGEDETVPLTAAERYQTERHHSRLKHWRECPWAAGLTEPTWTAERSRPHERSRAYGDNELEPDSTGCLCISARVCPLLRAGRVGNMVVLKSSHEWVEQSEVDEETAEYTTRRYRRPTLQCVVGPYWAMMACVTYPLIFGISFWTFVAGILPGNKPVIIVFGWTVCTVGLIVALAFTACCDPGILYRHRDPPPQEEGSWRWSDQAQSYRPRGAYYDVDTAVIVEGFDHT